MKYFFIIVLTGCTLNKKLNSDMSPSNEIVISQKSSVSLLNRIRINPGIYIEGSGQTARVFTKGVTSINNQKEVLFILDGVKVGNYSKVVNILDPTKIKTIEILKNANDIAFYGFLGSGGVILIKTQ